MTTHDDESPIDGVGELRKALDPPAGVEDRVVAALRSEGALVSSHRRSRFWAAAAAVLFLFGLGLGARLGSRKPVDAGPRFVLLLYEDAAFDRGDGSAEADRVREYSAWARTLAESGKLVAGEKLAEGGYSLAGREISASGPELAPGLAGYFVVRAGNDAEAREIATTCPHLRHGGRVVVRRIVPT